MEPMDGLPPHQRARALLTIAIAVGASVLGSALPNIALPTIAHDLGVTPASSVWVVNAYQIAIVISLLPCSSLGDIYGYRRVYIWGVAVFTLASLGCALAPGLGMLSAARVVQGLGAAGIMSVNTALIRYVFPRSMLGRGLGLNALIVATSSALGPTIAAGILAVGSWPWLFGINVPLGIAAFLMRGALPYSALSGHRFDATSAAMNAGMFGLFIAAVDGLGHGQMPLAGVIEVVGAVAVGFVFVRRQLSLAAPMLPVDLLRKPLFSLSVATSVCSFCAQTSGYVALPFLFQAAGGAGVGAIGTGLLMTPWPLTVAFVAPLSGRLSDRYPAGLLGGLGLGLMAAGLVLLATLPAQPAWWDVAWRMSLSGAGFALFQAPNNRLMLGSVPRERSGAGSGMLSTSRLFGQTLGAAMVGVVFHATEAGGAAQGAVVSILVGACFAVVGTVLSVARLRQG